MKKVWITYSWLDNEDNDIEYIAQQIESQGFEVKLDRWDISAGERLWDQIDRFISDPSQSDAWVFYATQNSLKSEPCKEEFAYALQRTLGARDDNYALIGLFPSAVEKSLIPSGISTRLYVSLEDPNWLERISASIKGEKPNIHREQLAPYIVKKYDTPNREYKYVLEFRPRAGTWAQPCILIPSDDVEKTKWILSVTAKVSGSGRVPMNDNFSNFQVDSTKDGKWTRYIAEEDATPSKSIYFYVKELPSTILFGSSIEDSQKYSLHLNKEFE
jgi:hypothetical protein